MTGFERIHGAGREASASVGIDLTAFVANDARQSGVDDPKAAAGGKGGGADGGLEAKTLSSFCVYWDVSARQYKVYRPKVVSPNGAEVAVTVPALGNGTWVCDVKRSGGTGTYSAEVKLEADVETAADRVMAVKLFRIVDSDKGEVEQYHVGAIVVPSGGADYIAGDDTNIVFTPVTSGANAGKIKVDVYYL